MKKSIALITSLFIASSAYASVQTTHNSSTVVSPSFETKAEALDAGFDITDSLKAMTSNQLRSKLPTYTYNGVRNLSLDETQVSVEEFAVTRGQIQYRAIVDVDYHFDSIERD